MSETIELLPCPFCGEQKIFLNKPSGKFKGSINCPGCLAYMPDEVNSEAELIECWNTRTPAPDGVREALVASQRLLADLVDGDKNLSTMHLWARAVGVELQARKALSPKPAGKRVDEQLLYVRARYCIDRDRHCCLLIYSSHQNYAHRQGLTLA